MGTGIAEAFWLLWTQPGWGCVAGLWGRALGSPGREATAGALLAMRWSQLQAGLRFLPS